MVILGLDPSLNSFGYAVILATDSVKLLAKGTIKSASKEEYYSKLLKIQTEIKDVIQKFKPDVVGIEANFVNNNAQTSLKLGVVRGICISIALLQNIPIEEYSPAVVKKTICGSGSGDKNQLFYMLNTLVPGHNCKTDDESDALSVAITSFFHKKRY